MTKPPALEGSRVVTGVGVSPGRGAGSVRHVAPRPAPPSPAPLTAEADLEHVAARIEEASATLSADLFDRAAALTGERRAVVETTAALALDPALLTPARAGVLDRRLSAERAVWEASEEAATALLASGGYVAERAADVHDVRDRLIALLTGQPAPGLPDLDSPAVLVAQDLSPVDTAGLDPEFVRGLVTVQGGPSSHTAILARALGIPAVVAAHGALEALLPGTNAVVDGTLGTVTADVDEQVVREVTDAANSLPAIPRFDGTGRTADGHRVHLYANVGSLADAKAAAAANAEGVGLLRTEVLFLDRENEPSVAEQTAAYTTVLDQFPGQTVIVRTLDAGSDKPMPFVTEDGEPNPALGVRGLRTSRVRPEVLEHQLQAIAAAAAATTARVRVMAPMVATTAEIEDLMARCARLGLTDVGIMVETPAAALTADVLLARATFASLGTNDLVQYTMAADRQLGSLAELSTPWQPAVLRLLRATCQGGDQQGRDVGVCGEAAADPALAVVLTGLGVTSLSMSPRAIDAVAAVLAATDLATCRRVAALVLACDSAEAALATARENLPALAELGL